jgi:phosphorylase kinase alpha/beta subunit
MSWKLQPPSAWLNALQTPADVRNLTAFLTEQGTFRFPTLPNGLFSAAAGEGGDFELTGYRNIWVRDNVHIAWAHWSVHRDAGTAGRCVLSLLEFFRRHRHRFEDIIDGRADAADPMNRPHIRFDGATLSELPEKWSHAQNDALGALLWLTCRLVQDGAVAVDAIDWAIPALLVKYWTTIAVWHDEDSGHWEEVRKVAASSIGCATAGLELLLTLMTTRDDVAAAMNSCGVTCNTAGIQTLIEHCRSALRSILPAECIAGDATQRRRYDAALLFLIHPLDVIRDRPLEDQILADVAGHLQGPIGIRRYPGDSYWCADYRDLLSAETRTADFSDNLADRDRLLRPGMEAQWCLFDPIVACIHGRRYQQSRHAADLQAQRAATGRALAALTDGTGRFPAYRCPESYFCEHGQWIPNDITPLLWTQGNLLQALAMLECSLSTSPMPQ